MSYTKTDLEGVPDKERQPEFYMETTRTTQIVSILVSLVLLGQGDTYGYKYKPPRRTGGHPRWEDQHPPEATTYKPTYAKTSRRISTSEIRLDRPYPVPSEAGRRDLALSLIPSGASSRRKATLLSTTSQSVRPPCRQQLDRLPQTLYWYYYGE